MNREERELWRRKSAGSREARDTLILLYRDSVVAIRAKRFPLGPEVSRADAEDLEAAGLNGLIHAVDRFEIEQGDDKWAGYSYLCILGYMRVQYPKLRGLSGKAGGKRAGGRAAWHCESLESEERPDGLPDPHSGDTERRLADADELEAALAALPDAQAELLRLHHLGGLSLKQAARQVGVTAKHAQEAHQEALEAARGAVAAAGYQESVEKEPERKKNVITKKRGRPRGVRLDTNWNLKLTRKQKWALRDLAGALDVTESDLVRDFIRDMAGRVLGERYADL